MLFQIYQKLSKIWSQDSFNYLIFFSRYNTVPCKPVLELEASSKLVFLHTREPKLKESGNWLAKYCKAD